MGLGSPLRNWFLVLSCSAFALTERKRLRKLLRGVDHSRDSRWSSIAWQLLLLLECCCCCCCWCAGDDTKLADDPLTPIFGLRFLNKTPRLRVDPDADGLLLGPLQVPLPLDTLKYDGLSGCWHKLDKITTHSIIHLTLYLRIIDNYYYYYFVKNICPWVLIQNIFSRKLQAKTFALYLCI